MKNPLVQYQISKDIDQSDMRLIASRFFKKDKRWHFFHEGDHCLVRIERRNKGFELYLQARNMKFTRGIWEDPHETVRKYQQYFEPIFHNFTILALRREPNEYLSLFNRVSHCFANMSGLDGLNECMYLADRMVQQILLQAHYGAQFMIREECTKIIPLINEAIENGIKQAKAKK